MNRVSCSSDLGGAVVVVDVLLVDELEELDEEELDGVSVWVWVDVTVVVLPVSGVLLPNPSVSA